VRTEYDWDDIVLSDHIQKNLFDDFNFFVKHEEWFRDKKIPFKRGYLLAGPPGNGKTMFINLLIQNNPEFYAFAFDFSDEDHNSNVDLLEAFKEVSKNTPAFFIFEDIDRVFGENNNRTHITLDFFLNQLDGVGDTRNGIVIIATANNPEVLNEALYQRPGRFDRVINFGLPNIEMREKMLRNRFQKRDDVNVSEKLLAQLAKDTDKYSMAFLNELFIGCGSTCFTNSKTIIDDAVVEETFKIMREQYSSRKQDSGFFGG